MKKVIGILIGLLGILLIVTGQHRKPFMKRFGPDFIIVHSVEHRPELGVEYVIITSFDDKFIVEVIGGAGRHGVSTLKGEKAKQYLDKAGLDY